MLIIRLDAIGDALALDALAGGVAPARDPRRSRLAPGQRRRLPRAPARDVVVAAFDLRSSGTRRIVPPSNASERAFANADIRTFSSRPRIPAVTGSPARSARPSRIGFDGSWGKPLKALWTRRIADARPSIAPRD